MNMTRSFNRRNARTISNCAILAAALTATPIFASHRDPTPLRDARILIADSVPRIRVESTSTISIRNTDRKKLGELPPNTPTDLRPRNNATIEFNKQLQTPEDIRLESENHEPIRVSIYRRNEWQQLGLYAGSLRVVIINSNRLDVINHVDVEDYVAGVVAAEAWPTFHDQALRGQAIVSRSFAIYHMTRDPNAEIDLSATQGAQVYRGIRSDAVGRRVDEAVDFTRGVVLVYKDGDKDRLFCTYYSAACGGSSQPAAPFGSESDVPPLRGNVPCDYCEIAPGDNYRWGPIKMSLASIQQKLTARYNKAKKIGRITSIAVSSRTDAGRPLTLRFTGSNAETFDLLAEKVRHTLGPNKIKSTDFDVRIDGANVIFKNGKGFGHGLGLCQWGMQGQALKGKRAGDILRYYYPSARPVRVY